MDTSEASAVIRAPVKRRMRSNAEKRQIVEESFAEGTSIAAVARAHGVNANLLFNWRRLYQQGALEDCREPKAALVPVVTDTATSSAETVPAAITIELGPDCRVLVQGAVDEAQLSTVLRVPRQR